MERRAMVKGAVGMALAGVALSGAAQDGGV